MGGSRDHLFFECVFGCKVWVGILRLMGSSHRVAGWGVELKWVCRVGSGKEVKKKLWHVSSVLLFTLFGRKGIVGCMVVLLEMRP